MRKDLIAILLAVTAAPASALQTEAPRPELLLRPPAEIAEALLRQMSRRYVTMADEHDGVGLTPLSLATAPESSDVSGLCRAHVLRFLVDLPVSPRGEPGIRQFQEAEVYRVVGDVVSASGELVAAPEAQSRLCAEAGPVLPSEPSSNVGRRYFSYVGSAGPYMAVAALQGAIRAARQGRYGRIECIRRFAAGACRNAKAEFGALDLADLAALTITPLGRDVVPVDYLLTATFTAASDASLPGPRSVVIQFNGAPFPPLPASFRYGRTQLTQ